MVHSPYHEVIQYLCLTSYSAILLICSKNNYINLHYLILIFKVVFFKQMETWH